jgi:hypothetical protein
MGLFLSPQIYNNGRSAEPTVHVPVQTYERFQEIKKEDRHFVLSSFSFEF